jgi:hypothetical protein
MVVESGAKCVRHIDPFEITAAGRPGKHRRQPVLERREQGGIGHVGPRPGLELVQEGEPPLGVRAPAVYSTPPR